ncbi:MAG: recombinase RecA, partial [Myxococcota bacterium]|nr:recombinase RecA [Myxococcota bacterium]
GTAAFIDAEHALDPVYARSIGIELEQLLVSQPDFGEQALDIVNQLIGSNEVDLVVVDSVAALVPRAELTGEMGDLPVGLQARLMSQALRKITGLAHKRRASIIFINQLRHKIGVTFGSNEVTTGGNALKFYSSMRLDVRRIGTLRDGQNPIGSRTRVRIVKNKLAPPFRQVEFDLLYGRGISTAGELLDLAEAQGILARSGSWFTLGETRLGQGRERARSTIEENPELARSLREQVLDHAAA